MSEHVALVTGAASGIGKAVAAGMAAEGHQTIVTDVNEEQGQAAAAEMGADFIAADLSQRDACRALVDTAVERYGKVDILVNNAGFQYINPIEEFAEDMWEKMLAVLLTAPFLLTKYVWPGMRAQGWGRVVNIGSVHSLRASPFKVGYISAKHGMLGLTRTTALEGAPYGITVNIVCPAYVRTPLVEKQIADQARTRGISETEVIEQVMLEPTAIKRLIEPDEITALVSFLVSDKAGAATGVEWVMDLGWTAH
jgi:3-hydroxybutyrate dehydrogenase